MEDIATYCKKRNIPYARVYYYARKKHIASLKDKEHVFICPEECDQFIKTLSSNKPTGQIYDVISKQTWDIGVGEIGKHDVKLGINRGGVQTLISKSCNIIGSRYILPENKSLIYTLVDFDTEEEYDCVSPSTMFLHLNIVKTNAACCAINDLRAGRCGLASINGKVFYLKGFVVPKIVTRNLKTQSPKCKEILQYLDQGRQIAKNIRRLVISGLKRQEVKKSQKTLKLLGCTRNELHKYIESKFKEGMDWTNYGYKGWHLDHIIPISSFDLNDPREQAKCFHYTNLQPLWHYDNFAKGDKLDWSNQLL